MSYTAEVTRDGRFWLINVPEIDRVTQARTVAEIEPMARDLIDIMTDGAAGDFELDVRIELPGSVSMHLAEAERLRGVEAEARSAAAVEFRRAALELKESGLSVRELGRVLGVSHQRASQLTAKAAS